MRTLSELNEPRMMLRGSQGGCQLASSKVRVEAGRAQGARLEDDAREDGHDERGRVGLGHAAVKHAWNGGCGWGVVRVEGASEGRRRPGLRRDERRARRRTRRKGAFFIFRGHTRSRAEAIGPERPPSSAKASWLISPALSPSDRTLPSLAPQALALLHIPFGHDVVRRYTLPSRLSSLVRQGPSQPLTALQVLRPRAPRPPTRRDPSPRPTRPSTRLGSPSSPRSFTMPSLRKSTALLGLSALALVALFATEAAATPASALADALAPRADIYDPTNRTLQYVRLAPSSLWTAGLTTRDDLLPCRQQEYPQDDAENPLRYIPSLALGIVTTTVRAHLLPCSGPVTLPPARPASLRRRPPRADLLACPALPFALPSASSTSSSSASCRPSSGSGAKSGCSRSSSAPSATRSAWPSASGSGRTRCVLPFPFSCHLRRARGARRTPTLTPLDPALFARTALDDRLHHLLSLHGPVSLRPARSRYVAVVRGLSRLEVRDG